MGRRFTPSINGIIILFFGAILLAVIGTMLGTTFESQAFYYGSFFYLGAGVIESLNFTFGGLNNGR